MKITTKAEAKTLGLKRYFTGEPCKFGHVAERMTSNRSCVLCRQEKATSARILPGDFNDVRLISVKEVRRLLGGVSEMFIYRLTRNPELGFPRPIKLTNMVPTSKEHIVSTRNFYRFSDITNWIAKREALSAERADDCRYTAEQRSEASARAKRQAARNSRRGTRAERS